MNKKEEVKKVVSDVQNVQNVHSSDRLGKNGDSIGQPSDKFIENRKSCPIENIGQKVIDIPNNSVKSDKSMCKSVKEESPCISVSDVRFVQSVQNVQPKDSLDKKDTYKSMGFSDVRKIIGGDCLSVIMSLLYTNKNITKKEISTISKLNYDTVHKTIKRNENLFQEGILRDGAVTHTLSEIGFSKINNQIKFYKSNEEIRKTLINKREEKKKTMEDIFNEAKEFFYLNKINLKDWIIGDSMYINFEDILNHSPEISDNLHERPEETINLLENALKEIELFGEKTVRIKNTLKEINIPIENIRSKNINKMICVEGRIASCSPVRPLIINAKFECPSCGTIISVKQNNKKFKEPSRCSCGRRGGFKELSKDEVDHMTIILEDLQDITDNPHSQRIYADVSKDLIDEKNIKKLYPGNEVRIVGILKEVPVEMRGGSMSTRLDHKIEIISVDTIETEIRVNSFTKEEIKEIKDIAMDIEINGLSRLLESFAPDVYGYSKIKEALILQACNCKNKPKLSSTRNKQNILLIGDPGIAKSVLCKYATKITPGSRKASGGGSSGVGITASVIKEEESMGGYRIEAGALPLAKELLFLDEMNNLTEDDKPKLQEAMSEQMISINKANLHLNLKVTAGILATANPIRGHFDDGQSYTKQFNIPSPILNRFDVIFVMKDKPNTTRDKAVASLMIKRKKDEINPPYSIKELRKFFAYVRATPEPKITEEITEKLKDIYATSRKNNNSNMIINPRFMEALNRMSEASAKIRLSNTIEEIDIERAIGILSESHFKVNEYKNFNFKK